MSDVGIKCFAWEGQYTKAVEIGGKVVNQAVIEMMFATFHGVLHYKLCQYPSGKIKIFTDTDWGMPEWWNRGDDRDRREAFKRDKQWIRTRNSVTRAGGQFTMMPAERSDTVEDMRHISEIVKTDNLAKTAWDRLLGVNEATMLGDILDNAETIIATERGVYMQKKAVAMASVDDQWGMF